MARLHGMTVNCRRLQGHDIAETTRAKVEEKAFPVAELDHDRRARLRARWPHPAGRNLARPTNCASSREGILRERPDRLISRRIAPAMLSPRRAASHFVPLGVQFSSNAFLSLYCT